LLFVKQGKQIHIGMQRRRTEGIVPFPVPAKKKPMLAIDPICQQRRFDKGSLHEHEIDPSSQEFPKLLRHLRMFQNRRFPPALDCDIHITQRMSIARRPGAEKQGIENIVSFLEDFATDFLDLL